MPRHIKPVHTNPASTGPFNAAKFNGEAYFQGYGVRAEDTTVVETPFTQASFETTVLVTDSMLVRIAERRKSLRVLDLVHSLFNSGAESNTAVTVEVANPETDDRPFTANVNTKWPIYPPFSKRMADVLHQAEVVVGLPGSADRRDSKGDFDRFARANDSLV